MTETGAALATVVIPTTEQPVTILSIENEDPDIGASLVCIAGTVRRAGIDRDYGAFVRPGSGVIARLFGHAFFRLDVSHKVDAGQSWELPVFLAHALHHAGRLSHGIDHSDTLGNVLVWATGHVSALTFAVGGVEQVTRKLELSRALFEEAAAGGKRVFAFVAQDNAVDIDPDMAAWLQDHGIEIHVIAMVDEALAALGLPLIIARAASKVEAASPRWSGNPYPGLATFTQEQRSIFFGRRRPRERCVELLRNAAAGGQAFLLVYGPSGIGKSSLVRAGVAGDITERAHEGGTFSIASMTPQVTGVGPLAMLAGALTEFVKRDRETLMAGLKADVEGVIRDLEQKLGPKSTPRRTGLLVIDQLEELYATPELHPDAEVFASALKRLTRTQLVWAIATLRSDFVGQIGRTTELAALASQERSYRLDGPSRHELIEIITAPAILAGARFEAEPDRYSLPDTLADQAMQSPDSLPLLQVVLAQLYTRADPQRRVLAYAEYESIGGFEGALERWADRAVAELIDGGTAAAEIDRALVDLVRFDPETGRGLARPLSLSEAVTSAGVIERLAGKRLVTLDEHGGATVARLAHEALITHWTRLKTLVGKTSTLIKTRDVLKTIRDKALDYRNSGSFKEQDFISGSLLIEGTALLDSNLITVDPDIKSYIIASNKIDSMINSNKKIMRELIEYKNRVSAENGKKNVLHIDFETGVIELKEEFIEEIVIIRIIKTAAKKISVWAAWIILLYGAIYVIKHH